MSDFEVTEKIVQDFTPNGKKKKSREKEKENQKKSEKNTQNSRLGGARGKERESKTD